MAKVYVVTSGSYSDYSIRGICSTRAKAQLAIDHAALADSHWVSEAEIEEWEVDELLQRKALTVWPVGMLLDTGEVVEPKGHPAGYPMTVFEKPFRSNVEQYGTKVPFYNHRPIVRVRSTVSHKHALKLAAEKRQQWLREKAEASHA